MKRFQKALILITISIGLAIAYIFTPNWKVYWHTKSGMQRSAVCLFGVPVSFSKEQETAITKRTGKMDPRGGIWVQVAWETPYDSFTSMSSWCHTRIEYALLSVESSVRMARMESRDFEVTYEDDAKKIATQALREFARTKQLCQVKHLLHQFAGDLEKRNFNEVPFHMEDLDLIFTETHTH